MDVVVDLSDELMPLLDFVERTFFDLVIADILPVLDFMDFTTVEFSVNEIKVLLNPFFLDSARFFSSIGSVNL